MGEADRGFWTRSQRRALIVIVAALVIYLGIRLVLNPATIPDPRSPNTVPLATRIDPNTATEAELAAIPTMGEKRAAAIVQYREEYLKTHPGGRAYTKVEDLRTIKGIGPATVETLQNYLSFGNDSH